MLREQVQKILEALLQLGILGAIFIFILVLAVIHRREFKRHWRIGLLLSGACFLLSLPALVFNLVYFDPAVILEKIQGPLQQSALLKVAVYFGLAVGVALQILKIGWNMIVYCVAAAEWSRLRPDPFPLLHKAKPVSWRIILGTAVFGFAAGVLSTIIFETMGVRESEEMRGFMAMFPGMAQAHPALRIPVVLLVVSAIAVVEEIVFRGAILGFLLRLGQGNLWAVVAAIAFVSLLWALLHIGNTNAAVVKCLQIFVIGLVLGVSAWRGCLEAAIAGHVALNLSAVALFFVFS